MLCVFKVDTVNLKHTNMSSYIGDRIREKSCDLKLLHVFFFFFVHASVENANSSFTTVGIRETR